MSEYDTLLTPEQVAETLHIRPQDVHALVRDGQLACVQIRSKRRLFLREHVDQFIESHVRHVPRKIVDNRRPSQLPSPKKGPTKSERGGDAETGRSVRAQIRKEMREECR